MLDDRPEDAAAEVGENAAAEEQTEEELEKSLHSESALDCEAEGDLTLPM